MEKHRGYPFKNELTETFHALYRSQSPDGGPPWIRWLGVNVLKCPMDLFIYQEIIHEIKPDYVIEGGTASGGSALYIATVLDALGWGRVVTVDWDEDKNRPRHPRITYIQGDTLKPETVQRVKATAMGGRKILILDDGHSHEHVFQELLLYTPLLTKGDYLIVEDTNLGGPLWGLDKFLLESDRFERDEEREKLLLTFNPRGYLKCTKSL